MNLRNPLINGTKQDLKIAVQLFTRIVAGHGQRNEAPAAGTSDVYRAAGTRIRDFLNLNTPSCTGSDPNEDCNVLHYVYGSSIPVILDIDLECRLGIMCLI